MMIFPLSVPGKIILVMIAVVLGLIFWMLAKPAQWGWLFKRLKDKPKEQKELPKAEVKK
jgi:hypothetical protein